MQKESAPWPLLVLLIFISASVLAHAQTAKPKITLDEFFNAASFPDLKLSPDGNALVIETERADWEQQVFRQELWLYRTAAGQGLIPGTLTQLTQSGLDHSPQWSPDGQWIAFLSERKASDTNDEANNKD